ncbi:hypothetical protein H1C71_035170 [Ictidomys tridecemlineatus]|nr:hypothetical protein H1C71_035170 [Ictidomys tridecemlineatus]
MQRSCKKRMGPVLYQNEEKQTKRKKEASVGKDNRRTEKSKGVNERKFWWKMGGEQTRWRVGGIWSYIFKNCTPHPTVLGTKFSCVLPLNYPSSPFYFGQVLTKLKVGLKLAILPQPPKLLG